VLQQVGQCSRLAIAVRVIEACPIKALAFELPRLAKNQQTQETDASALTTWRQSEAGKGFAVLLSLRARSYFAWLNPPPRRHLSETRWG
jgi:hypothetical protein